MDSIEVVLGFAIGYWVGTRQGREGMQRALDSAQEIMASPETRKLAGEALAAFESAAAPVLSRLGNSSNRRSKVAVLSSMVDDVMERRARRASAA